MCSRLALICFRLARLRTRCPAPPSAIDAPNTRLRESLGLSAVAGAGSPTGQGIVVAILDSGLSLSRDLDASRVTAFYDFTRPGCLRSFRRCAAAPSDDLGHGTHVAGLIGQQRRALAQSLSGRGPGGEVRRHQGAQGRRLGQDQRRHHGHRIRHQIPASVGCAGHHQPVARPPHLYAGDPRSARASGGAGLGGGDRGRGRGRQQREIEHLRGDQLAGQRALRAHDRGRGDQPHGGPPRRLRWPITARGVRRGSTPTPSRISWRPARV